MGKNNFYVWQTVQRTLLNCSSFNMSMFKNQNSKTCFLSSLVDDYVKIGL